MVGKKEKQSKIKENQQTEDEVEEKSYVCWSLDMERALANILRDERNLGNKGDAGWKTVAYNSASSKLSSQLHIDIIVDNVKNRMKTWKKLYGISHKDARSFRWKVISNWDDIVDLCGNDRATGEGAKQGFFVLSRIPAPPGLSGTFLRPSGIVGGHLGPHRLIRPSASGSRSRSPRFALDLAWLFAFSDPPRADLLDSRFALDLALYRQAPPVVLGSPSTLWCHRPLLVALSLFLCSLPVDQVLISKTEYDLLLQRANASSSLLIASGNTCLHSSSSPSWVIDSGASDHMTGNSSLLSHTSSPCSPSFVTIANGTKTPIQGKGTVTTSDLTLSDDLKTKRMIGGGFVKDGLYYFQPSSTSVPSCSSFYKFSISVALSSWAPLVVLTAAYLLNRMPSRILKGKSPFEMFFPRKNSFSIPPRVFGCVSFVHNHTPNRDKLDPCAHKCIFLGYSRTQKGYRCYSPSLRKHFVSADVTFFEDIPYYSPKGRQLQESMLSAPVIPTHVPIAPLTSPISIVPHVPPISQVYVRRRNHDVPLVPPPTPVEFSLPLPPSASTSEDSPPPQSTSDLDLPIAIRKGKRTCTEHPISNCVSFDHLSPSLSLSSLVVPKSYREALSHPGWRKAMEEEMHALELNHTWDLIPKPAGTSIVGCRWVFTVKQNPDGTVDRLKARLVAKGFTQNIWP
uniref:Uncharacterized protein n=1 Tax=Fagus sylvatica TaxID=28930 RepID=A0A2N9I8J9_FAGSY